MNTKKIILASIIMFFALGGIIYFQVYWIKSAMTIKQERFDTSVNEALQNVADNLEKKALAAKVTRRLNFHRQSERDEHLNENQISFKKRKNDYKDMRLNVYEEIITDSGGVQTKTQSSKTYKSGALNHPDFKINVDLMKKEPFSITPNGVGNKNLSWFLSQEDMMNDIFDESVTFNIYNDYKNKFDTLVVDSMLKKELGDKGINIPYNFGIMNQNQNAFVFPVHAKIIKPLLESTYKASLTTQNIFINARYLTVFFPTQQNHILRNLWAMLAGSLFLILLVLFMFVYTIVTIFRQKKLSEIKNDFINNMTHEFKTPISTISLACEVLGDNSVEKSLKKVDNYVKVIKDENKRLGTLVESILQTAVLDKGQLKLKFVELDVHEIIENVINNSYVQIENKNGEINIEFNAESSIVRADKIHLSNIIYNLLDNALKYTEGAPSILIKTKSDDHGVYVSVVDNGMGISKENQKRIFEKLYRVPTGNIHNVKGFGLGLSYVKAIVEKHGGNIFVESSLGNGSTFTAFFPYTQVEQ